ncbi:MAG: divergent polysaccharide deacetylase family protein [Alphaproteobacteria bacterium]
MHALSNMITSGFTSRSFLIGLACIAAFYTALMGWAFVNGDASIKMLENKLASETIRVIRASDPSTDIPADPTIAAQNTIKEPASNEESSPDSPPTLIANDNSIEQSGSSTTPTETLEPTATRTMPVSALSGLFETDSKGNILPIIRESDNLTPFKAYSAPFAASGNSDLIALVINDFGLPLPDEEVIDSLPQHTSIILSPYAENSAELAQMLLEKGHEIWLKLPFETAYFPDQDPGPRGILKRFSLIRNQENLDWVLYQAEAYAGIAAYTDVVFSNTNPVTNTIAQNIFKRGLGFFEINPGALGQIGDIATRNNAPYTKNDIFLSDSKWDGQFEDSLELLASIAEARGTAITVLPPYPEVLKNLKNWEKSLAAKNIVLAPLSSVLEDRTPAIQ